MIQKLTFCLMLLTSLGLGAHSLQAQNKTQQKAAFYAEQAAAEFGLDADAQQQIYQAKLGLMKANRQITKRKKSGEFESKEATKKARMQAQKPFLDKIRSITGASPKAFKQFNKRANEKMNAAP
ncbi:hypothetical protein [Pontibacter sp. G13]|uniref:hypothetical protein n=1 Tax=Pontibacter sp. G13 TaxID=3074898 RepID=UPI00288A9CDE|nr:hypothetical protein [Pontibacter sp. G13]WNJ20645.1 hypothetical protein RJD25_09185 [Pontibacter sp. G13]